MAFIRRDLSGSVGVGGGNSTPNIAGHTTPRNELTTLSIYLTEDTLAEVAGAGYFNDAYDVLEVNDLIQVEATDGFTIYRVSANDGAIVTVVVGQAEV